jgi:hypothetical protein
MLPPRRLLPGTTGALGLPGATRAQQRPFRIGLLTDLSGPLKAVSDLPPADRASGPAVVERMKAMPTDDDAFGPGRIRTDGRKIRPAYLLQVKTPAQSPGPWDYCRVAATTPAEEAFRPLGEGWCARRPGKGEPFPLYLSLIVRAS